MTKEKEPTIREKSLERADEAKRWRGPSALGIALTSIAYSLIRHLDNMDARYEISEAARIASDSTGFRRRT